MQKYVRENTNITSFLFAVMKEDEYPARITGGEKGIGHGKYPVARQPAVNQETNRCGKLPDEEPLRYAFIGTGPPLFTDLRHYCKEQHYGTAPAD